jgi:hypothetical protein
VRTHMCAGGGTVQLGPDRLMAAIITVHALCVTWLRTYDFAAVSASC